MDIKKFYLMFKIEILTIFFILKNYITFFIFFDIYISFNLFITKIYLILKISY